MSAYRPVPQPGSLDFSLGTIYGAKCVLAGVEVTLDSLTAAMSVPQATYVNQSGDFRVSSDDESSTLELTMVLRGASAAELVRALVKGKK